MIKVANKFYRIFRKREQRKTKGEIKNVDEKKEI